MPDHAYRCWQTLLPYTSGCRQPARHTDCLTGCYYNPCCWERMQATEKESGHEASWAAAHDAQRFAGQAMPPVEWQAGSRGSRHASAHRLHRLLPPTAAPATSCMERQMVSRPGDGGRRNKTTGKKRHKHTSMRHRDLGACMVGLDCTTGDHAGPTTRRQITDLRTVRYRPIMGSIS